MRLNLTDAELAGTLSASPTSKAVPVPRGTAASVVVYLGFVGMAALLLLSTPVRSIHDEEMDYGELPIAILDGLVSLDNLAQFQTFSREGALLLFAPVVAVVFRLLGPSLFALELAGVLLSGLWAVAWFRVARLACPRVPPALAAFAFIMPLPLVQLASVSIASIMTHLGSSLWHGVSLLALLASAKGSRRAALVSGLACGVGVYCGYSIVPLIPGLLWTGYRIGLGERWKHWTAGLAPPLVVAASFASSASLADVPTRSPHGPYLAELTGTILSYGAGVYTQAGRFAPRELAYSELAIAYPLLLIGLGGLAWRGGPDRGNDTKRSLSRPVTEGLGLSALGLLGALLVTRFALDVRSSDGLRYLLPLAAPFTLALMAAASRLRAGAAGLAVGAFILLNLADYSWLLARSDRAHFLHSVRGYRGSFFLHVDYDGPLLELPLPRSRRADYAMWMGAADALSGAIDADKLGSVSSAVGSEYWRGVGLGWGSMDPTCVKRGTCASPAPRPATSLVWQGVGASRRCSEWTRLRSIVPEAHGDDLVWGMARGGFADCEPWPGGAAAVRGAEHGLVSRLAIAGREAELLALAAEGSLPTYVAPELPAFLDRLSSVRLGALE